MTNTKGTLHGSTAAPFTVMYDILVRRWSGTDSVWYGIAWNTQAGFLRPFPFPFPLSELTRSATRWGGRQRA
jgi:hypothetical protein